MGKATDSQSVRTEQVVQRLLSEAADVPRGGRPSRVHVDDIAFRDQRPDNWPDDAVFAPCAWCTDRYMVVELIARGGFADIYAARDSVEERYVALKVIRADNVSLQTLEKSAAEARTLARRIHPNVVHVFDAGIARENGVRVLYFAMELLDGMPLLRHIYESDGPERAPRQPAIPLQKLTEWAIGIVRGLGELHRRNIVHRDLKPENIQITTRGPKLFDLNASKFDPAYNLNTTGRGFTLGTPSYMSPEHLRTGRADARSDLYQMAFVLAESVLGHHWFHEQRGQRIALEEMHEWHASRVPPYLSDILPGIPPELDALLQKCASKDPARRVQSCTDMEALLIAFQRRLAVIEATSCPATQPALAAPKPITIRPPGALITPHLSDATTDETPTAVPSSTPVRILPEPIFRDDPRQTDIGNPKKELDDAPLKPARDRSIESGIVPLGSAPRSSTIHADRGPTGTDIIPLSDPKGPHGTALVRVRETNTSRQTTAEIPAPPRATQPTPDRERTVPHAPIADALRHRIARALPTAAAGLLLGAAGILLGRLSATSPPSHEVAVSTAAAQTPQPPSPSTTPILDAPIATTPSAATSPSTPLPQPSTPPATTRSPSTATQRPSTASPKTPKKEPPPSTPTPPTQRRKKLPTNPRNKDLYPTP